ncbi:DUF3137 domain-containing protein [Candidatus Pacebacteria bacterium]|nr:DUF3137 domain-containing protein [Candidatus Paceibacterota bacterium]
MTPIKKVFPDEISLKAKLDEMWNHLTEKLLHTTQQERIDIQAYGSRSLKALGVAIGFSLLLWVFTSGIVLLLGSLVSLIAGVFAARYILKWGSARSVYTAKLNILLYEMVFDFFDLKAQHYLNEDEPSTVAEQEKVLQILTHSELLTERTDKIKVGDVFATSYTGNNLLVSELFVTRTEGSGKNRRTVTVFKGLFTSFSIPKKLTGTTFISTEGDETGYGHRGFWNSIVGKSKVEETQLEWNEFEENLHVATTDGFEARYILTTDFMEDLYTWWKIAKRNIRIVFRDEAMHMLFPDKNIKVSFTTSRSDTAALKKYAMTIITPIWHVLMLLDDVNERFPS